MKRSEIVDAILVRAKTIQKENGYLTDFGTNAEKDRTDPFDEESENFLIDIVAGAWETDDQSNQVRRWMNVSIAFACVGDTAITEAQKALQDIVKAIYTDTTWGGLAILTEETGGAIDKDVSDQLFAWGEVDMRILYATVEGEI